MSAVPPKTPPDKDVAFLVDQFGVAPTAAAELIGGKGSEEKRLLQAEFAREREINPLADVPTPRPAPNEWAGDADEDMLKPILRDNDRRGGS